MSASLRRRPSRAPETVDRCGHLRLDAGTTGVAGYEMPRCGHRGGYEVPGPGHRCLDLGTWSYDMPRSRNLGYEMPTSRNRGSGQRCLHLDISCLDVDIGAYI